jgi:hypothetical protein
MRLLVLSALIVLLVGCEQPQQPVTPADTTAVLDSVGWERIELVPGAYSAAAMYFNDRGMIVGAATYSNQYPRLKVSTSSMRTASFGGSLETTAPGLGHQFVGPYCRALGLAENGRRLGFS